MTNSMLGTQFQAKKWGGAFWGLKTGQKAKIWGPYIVAQYGLDSSVKPYPKPQHETSAQTAHFNIICCKQGVKMITRDCPTCESALNIGLSDQISQKSLIYPNFHFFHFHKTADFSYQTFITHPWAPYCDRFAFSFDSKINFKSNNRPCACN